MQEVLNLHEVVLTRTVTRTTVLYHLEVKGLDEQGNEKVFHYDDLNHPDLSGMQYFLQVNMRRAEKEHARRLIFRTGAADVIVEK